MQRRKRWPGETPRGDIGKQKGPCHSGTEESDLSLGFYEYARISNCGLHNQGYSSSSEELISTVINKQLTVRNQVPGHTGNSVIYFLQSQDVVN